VSYAAAGVDLDAAHENVSRIARHVRSTHGPSVLGDFGAFAGLFLLKDVDDPVLVASTDGVGSKVLLGLELGRHAVLGRDLVNLSVNDVLTTGARPLFFLDYVGLHAIDHSVMDELVGGMAAACRENGCALLGGETAQLPELYAAGQFDLVGTVIGVVERTRLIDGSNVEPGDRVWGLASTGLHTNGYTLARQIIRDSNTAPESLADALLAPHATYLEPVQRLLPKLKAIAHVTGGGVPGNLPRVLPPHVSAELEWGAWDVPPIFNLLQQLGQLPFEEMWRVFNLGLGLIVVAGPDSQLDAEGAVEIGRIVPAQSERVILRR
jgi:phosphoribosylformylglycinamidine cyclo-ligase